MGFVPVTGTATFRPAVPPRDSVVEFVDERRTVALPVRAAIPVLTKAHSREDLHPSVALLSGAAGRAGRRVPGRRGAAGRSPPGRRRRTTGGGAGPGCDVPGAVAATPRAAP